jgi:hypothetical protein
MPHISAVTPWLLLVVASFAAGLSVGSLRLRWWATILICPAISLGLGIDDVGDEPPGYDMHGFGYLFGGFFAVLCVASWLLGYGVTALARARRGDRR